MLALDLALGADTGSKSNRKRHERRMLSRKAGCNGDNSATRAKAKEKKAKDRQLLHRGNEQTLQFKNGPELYRGRFGFREPRHPEGSAESKDRVDLIGAFTTEFLG